jgi:hypothetical protein
VITAMHTGQGPDLLGMCEIEIPSSLTKLPSTVNALYPKPGPVGGTGKPVNQNGFSDHFPITMTDSQLE